MTVIKRYPNRKLYDTQAKQYITLERIAEIIRDGEEVQVIDHGTGEDITALTLSQVILEQEKRQSGFLPHALLTSLIKIGGDQLGAIQRNLASQRDTSQLDKMIETLIQKRNLATKDEVEQISQQLEELVKKLEDLT